MTTRSSIQSSFKYKISSLLLELISNDVWLHLIGSAYFIILQSIFVDPLRSFTLLGDNCIQSFRLGRLL